MTDMDRLSRKVPCLCKVAPNTENVHMEDVHRAGGIFSILGELSRAGLLHDHCSTVHIPTMGEAIANWDIKVANNPRSAGAVQGRARWRAHHAGVQPVEPLQGTGYDREKAA